jgi:hypothetical protein
VKRARVGAAGAARAEEAHTVGLYAMAERDLGLSGCSPYRINRVGVEWSGVGNGHDGNARGDAEGGEASAWYQIRISGLLTR